MKKFNIAVVVLWFALFALSLRPVNYEESGILDEAVVEFNYKVMRICDSCTDMELPMAEYNGRDYQIVKQLPLYDNRLTGVILANTFRFVAFMLAVINFAFYVGNGTMGRMLKAPLRVLRSKAAFRQQNHKTEEKRPIEQEAEA